MKNLLIKNCLVLPMTGRETGYFQGSVGISGGRIVFVSADSAPAEKFESENRENLTVIDGRGKVAMPGLVNTHNHISMSLMRGYADDIPLMPWLREKIWPFEAKLRREDIYVGAKLGMAEMLLGGTTTSADMYWMEEAVGDAAVESGMRIVLSPTFTDDKWEDFETDLHLTASKYASRENPLVTMMIAPHSAYTCSPEHLTKAVEYARKYDARITIHVSETLDEQTIVREKYGKTPIEHLDKLGILSPETLVVHGVHVNESDIEIMARRGVSMAHNPQSNMKLSSGIAPVPQMKRAGINVCLGTDGPCSNNDLDMWGEMRSASFLQKLANGDPCVLPAYEILEMATVNGARALGMEKEIGTLEAGKRADIILIDTEKPHLYPQHDMVANLVYCGQAADVDTVIVDGIVRVQNRKLLTWNLSDLLREAEQTKQRLLAR